MQKGSRRASFNLREHALGHAFRGLTAISPILALLLGFVSVVCGAQNQVALSLAFPGEDRDFGAHLFERRAAAAFADELLKTLPAPPFDQRLANALLQGYLHLEGVIKKADANLVKEGVAPDETRWEFTAADFSALAPSWDQVMGAYSEPRHFSSPAFHPGVAMEVAPPQLQAALRGVFVHRVLQRYGLSCARFFSDGLLVNYSPRLAGSVSDGFLENATGHDLMLLLAELPGDPRVIAALATRFEKLGMGKTARWLASRGFMSFIDYAASARCAEIVAKGEDFVMSSFAGGFPHAQLGELTGAANFRGTPLAVYDVWRSPFPGGSPVTPDALDRNFSRGVALLQEQEPKVEEAYAAFLESVADRITFAACLFAGECAYRLGKPSESAMLFWQALCTHPAGKGEIAWFYLFKIAELMEKEQVAEFCRGKLSKYKLSEEMLKALKGEETEAGNE